MKWLQTFWQKSFSNKAYRIPLHAVFWLFLLFFWMQESVVIHINWQQHISVTLVGIIFALFLYYPLVYLIVPLIQKRKWTAAFSVFVVYYFIAILLRSYEIELVVNWYNLKKTWIVGEDFWKRLFRSQFSPIGLSRIFFSSIPSLLEVIFVPLTIKFIRYAYRFSMQQSLLAQQNAQLQLATLKAQINPHFFFNTLNNLQSFIVQNEKEKSVNLLNRLADFMRTSLYECDTDLITMRTEIDLLNNYIDIERVRFSSKANIKISIADNDPDYEIPPFIFLPFFENLFKHGGTLPTHEVEITANIRNDSNLLTLCSKNKYHNDQKDASGGIGIQNVRSRLEYYFPHRYSLNIEDINEYFKVELKIFKK